MATTKKGNLGKKIGAGLLAAGAAAAAGYYFYGSKDGKKHRDAASKWAVDMKKQVMSQAKKLKNVDAQDFAGIVDTVMSTYQGVKSINPADLKNAAKELKANWKMVQSELKNASQKDVSRAKVVGKRVVASAKKTVKKTVRKTV
jgi:phage gp37-like protein